MAARRGRTAWPHGGWASHLPYPPPRNRLDAAGAYTTIGDRAHRVGFRLGGECAHNNVGVGGFEISGPGLVSTRGQASGTLISRGDPAFIYSGNLTVVNFGNSDVALALSDGTPLMTVPGRGSSTVRPYLALPPNEVVFTSTGGTYTEFVWVSRSN